MYSRPVPPPRAFDPSVKLTQPSSGRPVSLPFSHLSLLGSTASKCFSKLTSGEYPRHVKDRVGYHFPDLSMPGQKIPSPKASLHQPVCRSERPSLYHCVNRRDSQEQFHGPGGAYAHLPLVAKLLPRTPNPNPNPKHRPPHYAAMAHHEPNHSFIDPQYSSRGQAPASPKGAHPKSRVGLLSLVAYMWYPAKVAIKYHPQVFYLSAKPDVFPEEPEIPYEITDLRSVPVLFLLKSLVRIDFQAISQTPSFDYPQGLSDTTPSVLSNLPLIRTVRSSESLAQKVPCHSAP